MPRLQWEWMLESFVQVLAQVELSQIPLNRYVERFFNEFYTGAAMLIRRLRESASLLTTANPSTRALAIDMIHASDIFKWNKRLWRNFSYLCNSLAWQLLGF